MALEVLDAHEKPAAIGGALWSRHAFVGLTVPCERCVGAAGDPDAASSIDGQVCHTMARAEAQRGLGRAVRVDAGEQGSLGRERPEWISIPASYVRLPVGAERHFGAGRFG